MPSGQNVDLQALTQEMTGILEERIAVLLGQVRASRELAQQVVDSDDELEKLGNAQERLEAVIAKLGPSSPKTAEIRRKLEQVEAKASKVAERREELVGRLQTLKAQLDA